MNRITITEQDLTYINSDIDNTDVVFIPGFASTSSEDAAEPLIPTLCKSVSEFEKYFGKDPATFAADQEYPIGFPNAAIPSNEGAGPDATNYWFEAGDPDPSYIIAKELLAAGIPVLYERVNGGTKPTSGTYGVTVADMYSALGDYVFNYTAASGDTPASSESSLASPEDYDVKYITSGGYPTLEYDSNAISKNMLILAQLRGDAQAIIDHLDNPDRPLIGTNSVFDNLNNNATYKLGDNSYNTFGCVITPWAYFNTAFTYKKEVTANDATSYVIIDKPLPGSFAYLVSLAKSLKSYSNSNAIAGVTRGLVPGIRALHTNKVLTNSIAESYQPAEGICINAITNVRAYGLCIMGNRTLQYQSPESSKALKFINFRNILSDIKKQARLAAQSLLFEQNTDVLWINFNSMVSPLLDKLVSGHSLKKYKIVRIASNDDTKVKAKIIVYPIYTVEKFDIDITITDDEIVVE